MTEATTVWRPTLWARAVSGAQGAGVNITAGKFRLRSGDPAAALPWDTAADPAFARYWATGKIEVSMSQGMSPTISTLPDVVDMEDWGGDPAGQWSSGAGPPSVAVAPGHFYIDTTTGDIYVYQP